MTNANTAPTRADILVIGAGVSGLAAARQLADDDWKVTVLEARDRVGGRVWSNRSWPGLALDMGAGWIEGVDGNPLSELVREAKIKTSKYDDDSEWLYRADGTEVEDDEWDAQSALYERVVAQVEALRAKRIRDKEPDLALATAIEQVVAKLSLTPKQRAELDYQITTTMESDYAADTADLSTFHWDNGDEYDGHDVVFPGGYDQVPTHLARGLDVRLEHVVERVVRGPEGVRVTTNRGVFEADYAIVAVPLGVLKRGSIAFEPPLPEKKRAAIGRLGMGVLNRVYLRFPKVFWEKSAHGFGIIPRRPDEWTEYVNFYPIVKEPILLCFNSGRYALEVEALSDEAAVAKMMATLRGVFGDDIPNPTASLITRWSRDPYALGSYSYMAVGATPADIDALAEPVDDQLFFAGEATERDFPASVHGALLAGRRAADEIDEADE